MGLGYWSTVSSYDFDIRITKSSVEYDTLSVVTSGSSVFARVYVWNDFLGTRTSRETPAVLKKSGASYKAEVNLYDKQVDQYYYRLKLLEYEPDLPTTPSSITVPTGIKGGEKITISWGSSSGATRYHLERQVNGSSWIEIYNGTSLSYGDTPLETWNTVAYRVRAYNSDGYSGYRTSTTRKVMNFPEFHMKIDGVLKTSENGWVKIDGVLKEIDSINIKIDGTLKEV